MEKRQCGKRFLRNQVMVDDDHIDPTRSRGPEALVIGRPAVARHQQTGSRCKDPLERGARQPVASLKAMRRQRNDASPKRFQNVGDDGGARRAVDVVVPEYANSLARTHGPCESVRRVVTTCHRIRLG